MFVKENMTNRWISVSSAAARNTNEVGFHYLKDNLHIVY